MDVTLKQAPQTMTASKRDAQDVPAAATTFVIAASTDNPVATAFGEYLKQRGASLCGSLSTPADCREMALDSQRLNGVSAVVVVFLDSRDATQERALLDAVEELVCKLDFACVRIVSTFRVHFGDQRAAESESQAISRFEGKCNHVAVFRASHILAEGCPTQIWLRRLSFLHPVTPRRFKTCCVDADELFASLTELTNTTDKKTTRTYTLLGPNNPWKDWLAEHQSNSLLSKVLVGGCTVLKFLLVGQLAGLILDAAIRLNPRLHRLNFDTLRPQSTRELLTLYNPFNYRHVKVVGYNNGVVHFGWRFAGKTVVSTIHAADIAKVNGSTAKLDAGITIRRVRDVLGDTGKELYVIPNYSYVSVGTSFFIPIHGSASRYSTVGDTIERAVLYDPRIDRIVVAKRGQPEFEEYMYNLGRACLLLRLYLRVKDKSAYYVKSSTLDKPIGEQVLDIFDDATASNIELRKSSGDSETVQVCKYYTHVNHRGLAHFVESSEQNVPVPLSSQGLRMGSKGTTGDEELLEVPRDTIGRIWDKLEENRLASSLHHFFVRKFAYHVELFFSRDDFVRFWHTHSHLPIKKIQLRYIKRDGLRHSPFRDHDCISADLFTFKKHRDSFQAYLRENFPQVQVNPGKHSM